MKAALLADHELFAANIPAELLTMPGLFSMRESLEYSYLPTGQT
jgi:hypothetical protein